MNERDPKQSKAATFVANIVAAYKGGNPSYAAGMARDLRDLLNSMPSPGGVISEGAANCTRFIDSVRSGDKDTSTETLRALVTLTDPWGVRSFLGHLGVDI